MLLPEKAGCALGSDTSWLLIGGVWWGQRSTGDGSGGSCHIPVMVMRVCRGWWWWSWAGRGSQGHWWFLFHPLRVWAQDRAAP